MDIKHIFTPLYNVFEDHGLFVRSSLNDLTVEVYLGYINQIISKSLEKQQPYENTKETIFVSGVINSLNQNEAIKEDIGLALSVVVLQESSFNIDLMKALKETTETLIKSFSPSPSGSFYLDKNFQFIHSS